MPADGVAATAHSRKNVGRKRGGRGAEHRGTARSSQRSFGYLWAMAVQPTCRMELVDEEGVTTLHLVGELDVAAVPHLRECFHQLAHANKVNVVADLSELDFIDSTGIGGLVAGLKRMRENGGELALQGPSDRVMKVLEITGLDRVFTIA